MTRADIFGMLKIALQKGGNLQQTAQSLYNSGYPKEEIDEAIQALNMQSVQPPAQTTIVKNPTAQPKKPIQSAPKGQSPQIISSYSVPSSPQQQFYQPQPQPVPVYQQPQQTQQVIQKVSDYTQNPKIKMGTIMTLIMVAMLLILIGILVVVFMFKPEITDFINNL